MFLVNRLVDRCRLFAPNAPRPDLPLLVMLPGMDGTGWLMQSQARKLANQFDVRCLALPPNDLPTWDSLTQAVLRLMRQELRLAGSGRSLYLAGESFGACLALLVALADPDLLAGLIVCNPASAMDRLPWLHWGGPIARWLPQAAYELAVSSMVPLLFSLEQMEPGDRDLVIRAMQAVAQPTAARRLELLAQLRAATLPWQRLTVPVLAIASGRDRLLPSVDEARDWAARLPNACLHVLPESGHACLLEADVDLGHILANHGWQTPKLELAA